jgi:hypothetical protein
VRREALLVLLAALAACSTHPRDAVPDAATAMTTAATLCGWEASDSLHAEMNGARWHVWDDKRPLQAYVNRYDTGGSYVCIGL